MNVWTINLVQKIRNVSAFFSILISQIWRKLKPIHLILILFFSTIFFLLFREFTFRIRCEHLGSNENRPQWASSKGDVIYGWMAETGRGEVQAPNCTEENYKKGLGHFFGPKMTKNDRQLL